jgi:hypothetical protein
MQSALRNPIRRIRVTSLCRILPIGIRGYCVSADPGPDIHAPQLLVLTGKVQEVMPTSLVEARNVTE